MNDVGLGETGIITTLLTFVYSKVTKRTQNSKMEEGIPLVAGNPSPFGQALSSPNQEFSNDYDKSEFKETAEIVPGIPIFEGFELWVPPKPNVYRDGLPIYEIQGTCAQMVLIPLRARRKVMCFSGAMSYMSDGMKMEVQLAGFGKTFGRLAGGGSLFQLTYTNETDADGYIAMSGDYPGVIVPINMASCPYGKIVALRDSFLCATFGLGDETTDVGAGFNPAQSVAGFCCNGVDFIVQTIEKGDWVFLMAMGTVIQKNLGAGERILVDTESVLCFESSVQVDVQLVGGCITCCCSGEALFNTTFTGPGKIWIQSMSIDKMRTLFPPEVVKSNADSAASGIQAAL